MEESRFTPAPGVDLRVRTEAAFLDLARAFWRERAVTAETVLDLEVHVVAGSELPGDIEERLVWTVTPDVLVLRADGAVEVETGVKSRSVRGHVSESLLALRPQLAARLVLETPVAILMSRSGHAALHAGAVCRGKSAVVIRGASGAGKSTLVAALWKEGLRVLGDESVLVCRNRPRELVSSVRELTVLPDACDLLNLRDDSEPTWSGGEAKRRIDLAAGAKPEDRFGFHAATILLGARDPGPARLVALSRAELIESFAEGAVKEETAGTDLGTILDDWVDRPAFRLEGATDLSGAVRLVYNVLGTA
jgi:hypothetical protein